MIEVLEYNWKDKNCYLGSFNYEDISKYISTEESMEKNRMINIERFKEIETYIKLSKESTFFPPIILNTKKKIEYLEGQINLEAGSLIIIDGQHRISAIKSLMETEKTTYKNYKIPFVIIEDLSVETHRELFNIINDKSKNIEKNVLERFSPTQRNIICLKYISEEKALKNLIEWELKDSKEKLVYLHFSKSNEKVINVLKEKIDVSENSKFYESEDFYKAFKTFWDEYFSILKVTKNKMFWVKKVVIQAIVIEFENFIEESELEDINESIESFIELNLPKELKVLYKGKAVQNDLCYKSIRFYLKVNKLLELDESIDAELIKDKLDAILEDKLYNFEKINADSYWAEQFEEKGIKNVL